MVIGNLDIHNGDKGEVKLMTKMECRFQRAGTGCGSKPG